MKLLHGTPITAWPHPPPPRNKAQALKNIKFKACYSILIKTTIKYSSCMVIPKKYQIFRDNSKSEISGQ